ncbi:M12 family metallo-peptidase [Dokdonella sp.]|uniref:M12 family metallo-peptidase n=1 Tax=Dokdonella sp. TaxID=2291710 RepID=UPI001B0C4AD2|nr:M12 family metallo-peptidase [Dokdonella sp.]MBO9661434.1 hypothetical protein [Dokdonella sp.]
MHRLLALALLAAASSAHASDAAITLDTTQRARLATSAVGSQFVLDGVPDGYGGQANLRFERVEVYAPGARLVRVDAAGEHELPRSRRVHWIGVDAAGSVRASLSFDPGFERIVGSGSSPAGAFVWSGERDGDRLRLRARPLASALPAGVVPEIVPGEDGIASGQPFPDALSLALAGQVPAGSPRSAVVAIDTDNEFLLRRFGNDASAASDWIGDLFATMNVMYLRDLNLSLQQGTTYLRTTPDPYTVTTTPADGGNLNEFGSYWQNNYAGIPRSFAALLSGKSSSGNSASGIAWINAYCRKPSQGGSYSVNQVFTNAQIPVAYSARIVGHELGHNFGAYHTHCTNVSTGAAPSASNTIDRCFSGASGCYSGATSCPSSGPGAPAGSIMSYCNLIGCGANGQNVLQFHQTQVTVLSALIAQNTPSCIAASADEIFSSGFD